MITYLFNFTLLDTYINKHQQSSDRENGELTMFRDNCKKYVPDILWTSQLCTLSLDPDTGDVFFNWSSLPLQQFILLPGVPINQKMWVYRQVLLAIEEAQTRGVRGVFTEVKES